MLTTLVTVVHVLAALVLIVIVLFQHGKGASIGATFGGSSQTLFGSRGPATALAKMTTIIAMLFMVTSIVLSVLSNQSRVSSVIPASEAPAALPVTLPDKAPESPAAGPEGQPEGASSGPVEGPVSEPAGPAGGAPAGEPSGG